MYCEEEQDVEKTKESSDDDEKQKEDDMVKKERTCSYGHSYYDERYLCICCNTEICSEHLINSDVYCCRGLCSECVENSGRKFKLDYKTNKETMKWRITREIHPYVCTHRNHVHHTDGQPTFQCHWCHDRKCVDHLWWVYYDGKSYGTFASDKKVVQFEGKKKWQCYECSVNTRGP
jgi:hypothetical protein